jgi:hypothetical protein
MKKKNRGQLFFTLARFAERGQSVSFEKKAKKPARVRYERIADFCGHLRTEHLFFYMRACISFRSLLQRVVVVCVYVYVKVISIFSSLLLDDSRFQCVWTSVLFGVVQTLELVVFASRKASPQIPGRAVFAQVLEDIEMAVFGSTYTRKLISWAFLLCAILYDVKVAMLSCHIDCPIIPIKLFLFSQPTKQREVSRMSCLIAEKILRLFSLDLFGLSSPHWWIACPKVNLEGLLQLPL